MRILKQSSYFLFEHRTLSLCLAFLITFVPVIGVLGIVYAAFVTLRKGALEGALFAVTATVPYVISFYSLPPTVSTQFIVWLVLGVALLSNLLTWVFAVMLNRHSSWSQMVQVAALMGVLVISVLHLVYPEITDFWGIQLTQLSAKLKPPAGMTAETQAAAINDSKEIATGFIMAMLLLNAFLQLVAARFWQAVAYHHSILRRELHNIRLSPLAGLLFIASLVTCLFFGNSVILDMMPVLYLLFTVAALSLIHYLFGMMQSATRSFWLLLMYVVVVFTLPVSIYILAMIGLADIWLDVRKRFIQA